MKVQNPKTEVPCTIKMNDKDYINDILESEKNMSNNFSIALNEMSNDALYNEVFNMFKDIKDNARKIYNLMFQNGWYSLEKAEVLKISEEFAKLNKQLEEFSKE